MKHNNRSRTQKGIYRRFYSSLLAGAVLWLVVGSGVLIGQEPIRVSHAEGIKAAVSTVQPDYPAMARQMKIAGEAELDVTVDTDGTVEKVDIVKGNALLTNAAAAAAKRWKFKPFEADGKPSKALVRLAFNFSL